MIRKPAPFSARRPLTAVALCSLTAQALLAPGAAMAQRASSGQGQALLLETAGKWQAFSSQQGRSKICYALSKAESRSPANLKDVEGLLFISNRPTEGVRNEISLVMNFDLKEDVEHQAIIGSERFVLVAKGLGTTRALTDLEQLLGRVRQLWDVPRIETVNVNLPNHSPDPLPGFRFTLTTQVTQE